MDAIEIAPDPPLPAHLIIPFDTKSVLPKKHLPVVEFLQYKFPDPFQTPHNGPDIPVWSGSLPHNVHTALLLAVQFLNRRLKQLLLDVQWVTPTPCSFNRSMVLPCEMQLPSNLPLWVLSFWDCLSEAYNTCLSWRRCVDWVKAPCAGCPADQYLITKLDSLFQQVCWHGYLAGKC